MLVQKSLKDGLLVELSFPFAQDSSLNNQLTTSSIRPIGVTFA